MHDFKSLDLIRQESGGSQQINKRMDLINKFKLKPANKTNTKIVSFNPAVREKTVKN